MYSWIGNRPKLSLGQPVRHTILALRQQCLCETIREIPSRWIDWYSSVLYSPSQDTDLYSWHEASLPLAYWQHHHIAWFGWSERFFNWIILFFLLFLMGAEQTTILPSSWHFCLLFIIIWHPCWIKSRQDSTSTVIPLSGILMTASPHLMMILSNCNLFDGSSDSYKSRQLYV